MKTPIHQIPVYEEKHWEILVNAVNFLLAQGSNSEDPDIKKTAENIDSVYWMKRHLEAEYMKCFIGRQTEQKNDSEAADLSIN